MRSRIVDNHIYELMTKWPVKLRAERSNSFKSILGGARLRAMPHRYRRALLGHEKLQTAYTLLIECCEYISECGE